MELEKLKEENERLKREYDILDGIIDVNNAKIQALKDENERLKEEIKEVKKYQYQQEYLDKEIKDHQKLI